MLENQPNLPASLILLLSVFPKPRSDPHRQTSTSGSLTHDRPGARGNRTRRSAGVVPGSSSTSRLDSDPQAALLLKGKRLRETTSPNTPSSQMHICGFLTVFRPFLLSHHLYSYSTSPQDKFIHIYLGKKRHTKVCSD